MSEKSRDGQVGYGRPPIATQFKKGQSGNPAGRPRKSPTIQALVERELNREIPESKGSKVMIQLRVLVARAVIRNMMNGNMRTISWFEEVVRKHPEDARLPEEAEAFLGDLAKGDRSIR